jgi:hypothetical protein
MRKRTEAQLAFDGAKHGWAFCDARMLIGRLETLRALARNLDADDERYEEMRSIERAAEKGRP